MTKATQSYASDRLRALVHSLLGYLEPGQMAGGRWAEGLAVLILPGIDLLHGQVVSNKSKLSMQMPANARREREDGEGGEGACELALARSLAE